MLTKRGYTHSLHRYKTNEPKHETQSIHCQIHLITIEDSILISIHQIQALWALFIVHWAVKLGQNKALFVCKNVLQLYLEMKLTTVISYTIAKSSTTHSYKTNWRLKASLKSEIDPNFSVLNHTECNHKGQGKETLLTIYQNLSQLTLQLTVFGLLTTLRQRWQSYALRGTPPWRSKNSLEQSEIDAIVPNSKKSKTHETCKYFLNMLTSYEYTQQSKVSLVMDIIRSRSIQWSLESEVEVQILNQIY